MTDDCPVSVSRVLHYRQRNEKSPPAGDNVRKDYPVRATCLEKRVSWRPPKPGAPRRTGRPNFTSSTTWRTSLAVPVERWKRLNDWLRRYSQEQQTSLTVFTNNYTWVKAVCDGYLHVKTKTRVYTSSKSKLPSSKAPKSFWKKLQTNLMVSTEASWWNILTWSFKTQKLQKAFEKSSKAPNQSFPREEEISHLLAVR